ncbi:MAG: hypothetical protein IJW03_02235 [Clostridia bacterium]|nr:hypothetical protein [Clostridia bacterium]
MAKTNKPTAYKNTRLKFSKLAVLVSCLVFGVLIGALANLAMAFISSSDELYSVIPSGAISFDANGFALDYRATLDVQAALGYILSGALLGAAVGAVLAIVLWIGRSVAENNRSKKAEDVRASLEPVRHILTDGYAIATKKIPATKAENKKKMGTLLLTNTTLEFYNGNYTKAEKNFLLKLTDVISVRSKNCLLANNKIIVTTSKASYTFRVPMGTANTWKKRISHEVNVACKQ